MRNKISENYNHLQMNFGLNIRLIIRHYETTKILKIIFTYAAPLVILKYKKSEVSYASTNQL